MAAPPDAESLESRINRATNPLNRDTDWSSIHAFCEQLNSDLEGPQLATRLLAHKIQSPQEWEAMQALLVLETCMKNCGKRFHSEVGKFRFLNELIKVVSPKYLGSRSPEPVKKKVLELIYSWTVALPDEAKITDAYQMLKKQGIVKKDPELPPDRLLNLPPPRPKNTIFEDEEKSKMLSRLLNSSHPEDLKAANKLIKEMVQEDQKRTEKVTKRVNAIQEVKESVALLSQLLQGYDSSATSQSNAELIQVAPPARSLPTAGPAASRTLLSCGDLYQRCEKMRPTLFRLASDTEDNDEALGELSASVLPRRRGVRIHRPVVPNHTGAGQNVPLGFCSSGDPAGQRQLYSRHQPVQAEGEGGDRQRRQSQTVRRRNGAAGPDWAGHIAAVAALLPGVPHPHRQPERPRPGDRGSASWTTSSCRSSSDSIDADLPAAPSLLLSPDPPPLSQPTLSGSTSGSSALDELDLLGKSLLQQSLPPEGLQVKCPDPPPVAQPTLSGSTSGSSALDELDLLGKSLLQQSLPPEGLQVKWDKQQVKPTLRDLQSKAGSSLTPAPIPAFCAEAVPHPQPTLLDMSPARIETPPPPPEVTLTDVFVPLESIRPSSLLPVTVFDGHSLRVLFHFARDSPPSRPDVLVVIISMLSSASGARHGHPLPGHGSEDHGGEAAAAIGDGAPGLQPHPSSGRCHTDPAAGEPKQGEPRAALLRPPAPNRGSRQTFRRAKIRQSRALTARCGPCALSGESAAAVQPELQPGGAGSQRERQSRTVPCSGLLGEPIALSSTTNSLQSDSRDDCLLLS
ncbi:unnamed protein product [Tetraodon nigroviridis]|uniref:(spotted green pufferfish) hypothetical protein n=1 Tax=Tetraodon nigroviridis TaxID=99883 RepID=Q4T5C8_TETNG|nr:unnamed protein product [Tetraodon nigroviridis]